jgi:hypothetical protein
MSTQILDPNDESVIIGYECTQLVSNNANQLVDFDLIFYVDAAAPVGQQELFVEHMQQQLVPLIATRYGVRSETGCMSPPIDGSSWILKFTLETKDFVEIDLFGTFLAW